ncbi:MAG TPA: hypothetical protein VMJ72_02145 [Candidatus Paceibacterota bacterium]|nr:hypothetical protein [Candidatus Paceibacterota bacterium]
MFETAKTQSLDELVTSIRFASARTNPYLLFSRNGLREVRQACLKATQDWYLDHRDADAVEAIATSLRAQEDPLWQEYLQAYLFCRGGRDISQRALRFFLEQWPTKDPETLRFRSKALCSRMGRAIIFHESDIYDIGRPYLDAEIVSFSHHCGQFNFYQNDEWYRFERATKVAMQANDSSVLDVLRHIAHLYRPRMKPLLVTWVATDQMFFPIIREQHLVFIRGAIRRLESARRKADRSS